MYAHLLFLALLAMNSGIARAAPEPVRDDNLLFGAVADDECDETTFGNESALIAGWIAKFAVNAAVGFATSLLDKATETATVIRNGAAPGFFYRWDIKAEAWLPDGGCIRFWYGRQRSTAINTKDPVDYGVGPVGAEVPWKKINTRWAKLGFAEQPYLYGEVRVTPRTSDNLIVLQPVVLFARRPPEALGFMRKSTRLAIALDLKALGADTNLATQLIELPDVAEGPILIRGGTATKGLASGWASLPVPPKDNPKKESGASPFTALVTFTSSSDGTLFGKVLASTFKSQKEELAAALTPKTKVQRAEEQQKAMSEAFDAIGAVLDAQAALDKATDATKAKLSLDLQKAQYLANLKLQAAGLPQRYEVAGP